VNPDAVAIVITCRNLGRTLLEAVDSVLRQTRPASELLIVDDGSDDLYTRQELAALERDGHRVERTPNRGVSAARNAGIRATSASSIVLLDADDMLAPQYIEKLGACLDQDPALDYVSCAMRGFGGSSYIWRPPDPQLPESIITGVVHASSMFRRGVWETVGGFDETVPRNEVLDFWTTVLEHGFRGIVLEEPLLLYRVRPDSQYHATITDAAMAACMQAFYRKHWHTVTQHAEEFVVGKEAFLLDQWAHQEHLVTEIDRDRHALEALRAECNRLRADLRSRNRPALDMGELRQTSPFSPRWGVERGRPIDRYYIEGFLDRHRQDVRGRVLEIKDAGYTRMFGDDRVAQSDVLDIDERNGQATLHVDLASADAIPDETFDAFILTQTLELIYDVGAALRHARRILKPGGVLLCTVPAAGRLSHEDKGLDGDFWRFTEAALRRLFGEEFPVEAFDITGFGNALVASAFLFGLADHELTEDELNAADPYVPLVYGIRAVKPQPAAPIAASDSPGAGEATAAKIRHLRPRGAVGRAVILAYHRVSRSGETGPWVIPAGLFRAHMAFLRERYTPVPLVELAVAVRERRLPDRAVTVTLDDGYLDCLTEAAPILVEYRIPATAFVTNLGEEDPGEFYWDLLQRLFEPDRELPDSLDLPETGLARMATATLPERTDARRQLNERFYAIPDHARTALAEQLRSWAGLGGTPPDRRPLTGDGVRRLGSMPGIAIGAHGRSHLCMPLHGEDLQREEVETNTRWLEHGIGSVPVAFAYPYGERDGRTLRVLRDCGLSIGVTADGLPVEDGCPTLLLPRCEVQALDITAFAAWLDERLRVER
jgi:glycosyltransferase involved in cell wall biosynthesis/peptidoglycan/xylan/chitin deacetylase (PgdA/CDA1 family)